MSERKQNASVPAIGAAHTAHNMPGPNCTPRLWAFQGTELKGFCCLCRVVELDGPTPPQAAGADLIPSCSGDGEDTNVLLLCGFGGHIVGMS